MVALERQRLVEDSQRILVLLEGIEDQPEIRQRIGRMGIDVERGRDQPQGVDLAALLVPQQAEQVQRIEFAGIPGEDGGVDLRGFLKAPLAMQRRRLYPAGHRDRMPVWRPG